ncbi:MAG TPA: NAD(P)H-binding protein [Gemmatimonadaceae bacterium]
MKVILFGATGMVGAGVLHECLRDDRVTEVLAVLRTPTGQAHAKLRELIRNDFYDYSDARNAFRDAGACFFCLGVTAVRKTEADYSRLTYDLTIAAARTMAEVNPGMTFCYVSGQGTDSSEKGRVMWARVKGRTENALLRLPLQAYMLRPGYIQPQTGVKSKTRVYRVFYEIMSPLYPVLRRLTPNLVTSSETVGRAMIALALEGYDSRILEVRDINRVGR